VGEGGGESASISVSMSMSMPMGPWVHGSMSMSISVSMSVPVSVSCSSSGPFNYVSKHESPEISHPSLLKRPLCLRICRPNSDSFHSAGMPRTATYLKFFIADNIEM
jgi:hypothetical protein